MKLYTLIIHVFLMTYCILLMNSNLKAELPDAYLYYNFEESAGSTVVIDSSGNEREGSVVGNVKFEEEEFVRLMDQLLAEVLHFLSVQPDI